MARPPQDPRDPLVELAAMVNMRRGFESEAEIEDRRKDIAEAAEQSEQSAMAEGKKTGERPGTKTLDYIALGLLLAPPAVVVDMYLKGTSIDWRKTAIAAVSCWIAGAITVWASHAWQAWPSKNWRALPYLIAAENNFWGKAIIVAVAISGALALSSVLSNNEQPAAQQPTGFTQQQVDEKIVAATKPLNDRIAQLQEQQKALLPPVGNTVVSGLQLAEEVKNLRSKVDELTRQNDALRDAQKNMLVVGTPPPQQQAPSAGPITWDSQLTTWTGGDQNGTLFLGIGIRGKANALVELTNASIDSEVTGEKQTLQVSIAPGPRLVPISSINQIPPGAPVELWATFTPPIHGADLLAQWGRFRFRAEYSGVTYDKVFDEDFMRKFVSQFPGANIGPHVTPKAPPK